MSRIDLICMPTISSSPPLSLSPFHFGKLKRFALYFCFCIKLAQRRTGFVDQQFLRRLLLIFQSFTHSFVGSFRFRHVQSTLEFQICMWIHFRPQDRLSFFLDTCHLYSDLIQIQIFDFLFCSNSYSFLLFLTSLLFGFHVRFWSWLMMVAFCSTFTSLGYQNSLIGFNIIRFAHRATLKAQQNHGQITRNDSHETKLWIGLVWTVDAHASYTPNTISRMLSSYFSASGINVPHSILDARSLWTSCHSLIPQFACRSKSCNLASMFVCVCRITYASFDALWPCGVGFFVQFNIVIGSSRLFVCACDYIRRSHEKFIFTQTGPP